MQNRIIKFRAWDKRTKKMSPEFVLFGEFLLLGLIHDWQHHEGNKAKSSLEALNDLEIMQYTGLKDKNGKEIYEGDIIILPAKQRCLVEWGQNGFICIAIAPIPNGYPKQYESWGPKAYMNEYEVIGNIYEHPHLLSQGEIKTELI